jgi:hypothetical protein
MQQREPAEAEDEQHLLGRVRHRRQGSEQNTGSASRFGSKVSSRRSLRNGSPTKVRATAAAEDAMRAL